LGAAHDIGGRDTKNARQKIDAVGLYTHVEGGSYPREEIRAQAYPAESEIAKSREDALRVVVARHDESVSVT